MKVDKSNNILLPWKNKLLSQFRFENKSYEVKYDSNLATPMKNWSFIGIKEDSEQQPLLSQVLRLSKLSVREAAEAER